MYSCCDLHTHSDQSDGRLSMQALTDEARRSGIGVLAITDHNVVTDLTDLRRDNPDMVLIQGVEASCHYPDSTGKVHQVHILGLGFDPAHPAMVRLMKLCDPDRTPYNQAQLDALRRVGIDLGTLAQLRERWPGRKQLGTRQFGEELVRLGHVSSVREAYDRYLGYEGSARVVNELRYPTVEETVEAICKARGIPVLAHLYYYGMSDADNHRFAGLFRELAGPEGAMETEYGAYTPAQRQALRKEFAGPYGLMESCASDYHGVGLDASDTLNHGFRRERFAPLLERLGVKTV